MGGTTESSYLKRHNAGKDAGRVKMIAIITDNQKEQIGTALYHYFRKQGEQVELISASERKIEPCYGCEGCTNKTYNQCVVRDDMDVILPILIKAEIIVFVSPLWWGGFSGDVKKILDKTALIGDCFYHVKNGELYKGTIGSVKKMVGLAVSAQASEKAESCFAGYLKEIGILMGIDAFGKVVSPDLDEIKMEQLGMEVLS